MNTVGNFISGQVLGDTAKQLSERFGKIMQDRKSVTINRNDTSINKSKQLDQAVPPSTISSLSSGEFVGMVADTPDIRIELKAFHNEIINDHSALEKESKEYRPIPAVREISIQLVEDNYKNIKLDIAEILETELDRIYNTPKLNHLLFDQDEG